MLICSPCPTSYKKSEKGDISPPIINEAASLLAHSCPSHPASTAGPAQDQRRLQMLLLYAFIFLQGCPLVVSHGRAQGKDGNPWGQQWLAEPYSEAGQWARNYKDGTQVKSHVSSLFLWTASSKSNTKPWPWKGKKLKKASQKPHPSPKSGLGVRLL